MKKGETKFVTQAHSNVLLNVGILLLLINISPFFSRKNCLNYAINKNINLCRSSVYTREFSISKFVFFTP